MTPFLAALLLLPSPEGWKSRYFEDVALHRNTEKVTVQVAWLEPEVVSTSSQMPAVLSIYSGGRKGSRSLLSSTNLGSVCWDPSPQIYSDPKSGEAFLFLAMSENNHWNGGVFRFEGLKPVRALSGNIYADDTVRGAFREHSNAIEAEVKVPAWDHPDPPVERLWRFDPKRKRFVESKWQVRIFNPPSVGELRGSSRGHKFLVRLRKRNFRLGGRKIVVSDSRLRVGGLRAYGTDTFSPDESTRGRRSLFMTELVAFDVWLDGKKIEVPKRLWSTCFEPHLDKDSLRAKLSERGSAVRVSFDASDGAGAYRAVWTIRKNGKHSREVVGLG